MDFLTLGYIIFKFFHLQDAESNLIGARHFNSSLDVRENRVQFVFKVENNIFNPRIDPAH